MARMTKRYHPPGTPPGTLIRRERHRVEPGVAVLSYDEDGFDEIADATLAQCGELRSRRSTTWIHVSGHLEIERLQELGTGLGLHPLALEDVVNSGQRPKTERYDGRLFVVVNLPVTAGGAIHTEQVSLYLAEGLLVSFHEGGSAVFEPVRRRVRESAGWLRGRKADALLYALLDFVVDHGFPVLEALGEQIEELESEILRAADRRSLNALHRVKRGLVNLRRMLWPQREALSSLLAESGGLITEPTRVYLRDCHDHAIQIMDLIEAHRDAAASLLDVYLSGVSVKLNETMRVLTVIATIFIPPTFLASVYGMNFDRGAGPWNMPELGWAYGYPALWGVMLVTMIAMLFYFRRRGWF